MSMISELVEELIDNADLYTKELHDLMYRAVDTIEMLSEKAREPKRGKWEEREIFHIDEDKPIIDQWQSARCSECGKYHTTPYMYYFDNYDFCPHCGASMKGEQDDNNL